MNINVVKWLVLTGLFCIVPALTSNAATVSIMVVETGGSGAGGMATFWESGIMNELFESGHIVSNAPAVWVPHTDGRELPAEARRELNEAANGGADYFVVILLANKDGTETPEPEKLVLYIYKIRPRSLLYNEKYVAGPILKEGIPDTGNLARTLVSQIMGE
jgi:hypothetical protein